MDVADREAFAFAGVQCRGVSGKFIAVVTVVNSMVVYGICIVVGWLGYNRILRALPAVDVRVSLTEKRLVLNYVYINIMNDSKQHQ